MQRSPKAQASSGSGTDKQKSKSAHDFKKFDRRQLGNNSQPTRNAMINTQLAGNSHENRAGSRFGLWRRLLVLSGSDLCPVKLSYLPRVSILQLGNLVLTCFAC